MKTRSTVRTGIATRLVRQGDDEEEFDFEFWHDAGATARVAALWEMLLDSYTLKGALDDHEPGLQRSFLRIRRP